MIDLAITSLWLATSIIIATEFYTYLSDKVLLILYTVVCRFFCEDINENVND